MLAKVTGNKMILGAVVGIVGGLIVAVLLVVVLGVGKAATPPAAEAGAAPGATAAKPAATAKPGAAQPGQPAGEAGAKFGPTYEIKDRIVNLADPGGRRYLRYTVALEFLDKTTTTDKKGSVSTNQLAIYIPDEDGATYQETAGAPDPQKEFLARIQKYTPALEDVVTTVLSSKTSNDLSSAEGKDAAKKDIKDRCQRILGSDETITNVYFTEFVMQ